MAYLEVSNPLWQLIASVVADEGLVLYDAELMSPKAMRLSIAREESGAHEAAGEGPSESSSNRGVSVGDCGRVLKRLMVLFQAEGHAYGISPEPEIDVSSPGINRSLRLPVHFTGALGERVKLVLRPSREVELQDGKKTGLVLGQLAECREGKLTVLEEHSRAALTVALDDVKRANVEFQFS